MRNLRVHSLTIMHGKGPATVRDMARLMFLGFMAFAAIVPAARAQQGGAVPSGKVEIGSPRFRVIRSISGSKGSVVGGRYIIQDPRSTFYVPEDKQVVVYFDWEGPVGTHHLEGFWKNPEGKVVSLSDFNYDARQTQFGAYWTVPLAPEIEPGTWTLEVRIDGESAGTHTFQVYSGSKPADGTVPRRKILAPSDIYRRLLSATMDVEKLGPSGESLGVGSAFFIGEGLLLTTFQAVDSASSIRITSAEGKTGLAKGILAWNRRGDWAILKVPGDWPKVLPQAPANSVGVGDRCFTLGEPTRGNRVIVDGNVIGKRTFPVAGERLSLSFGATHHADGSPIVNEYGETIGMISVGSLLPGSWTLWGIRSGLAMNLFKPGGGFQDVYAIPIEAPQVPAASASPKSFAELSSENKFTPVLVGYENIERGSIGLHLDKTIPKFPDIRDEKFDFSERDKEMAILVSWSARTKIKAHITLQIYDLDNRLLMRGKPMKIHLSVGKHATSTWTMDISKFPTSTYRLDLDLDDQPCWRTFFRIVQ